MGVINETLLLTDQFSSSFNTFIDLGNRAVATTTALDKSLTHALGKSAGATIGAIRGLGDQAAQTNQLLEQIVENQQRHKEETEKTDNAAKKLLGTIKKIAAASGALALAKSFLGFSDAQAQVNARMNLINDGQQTTAQLNELIYQSALRAKSSYFDTADAVSKMGLNAKNAFSSNQELIAFTEQVNKQFKIGGASAQEQNNAMVQLTQAMAAGVLRGQDLNSILAAAPGIARAIEESMGWASGSIKKYAEDGKVTAQVVKNAMLDMADQTNAKFESIPMTLSDAMTMGKNIVQHGVQNMAAQWNEFLNTDRGQEIIGEGIQLFSMLASAGVDALSAIGRGALWVHDNMDFIIPILLAIAAGIAVMKAAEAAATIAGNLAKAASWALANWYIILGVALLASALIAAQQYGAGMQEIGGVVGGVFGFIYAVGYNVFASLWNIIATFAEFFANVFNDPVAAIAHLFSGLLDTILGMVQTAASAIDALLGSNISGAINGFRNDLSSWVDSTFGENAVQIKRMANLDVGTTMKQWGSYGAGLGSKLDNLSLNVSDLAGSFGNLNLGDGAGGLGDIGNVGKVGSVGKIDNDVKLSDEDLKLYRNLAERRYMNQIELKTLAPHIDVSIPESEAKNLTAQDIADKLRALLIEQSAAGTAVSHG